MLDTASNQVVGQIPVGASPHYPPFTPDGQVGPGVVQGPGELASWTPASNTVSRVVAVGTAPHWIAASADGRTAYVTNEDANDVSVVDLAGRRVMATIAVGNAPRKIAVQPGAAAAAASPATATAAPASRARPSRMKGVTYADHGTKDVRKLSTLELEADDYYFAPTFLRGAPGQTLTLMIENEASLCTTSGSPPSASTRTSRPRGRCGWTSPFRLGGALLVQVPRSAGHERNAQDRRLVLNCEVTPTRPTRRGKRRRP